MDNYKAITFYFNIHLNCGMIYFILYHKQLYSLVMGGMESCCSQTTDTIHKEEDTLKNLAFITDQDEFMNRIVQDASKQVKELKR